MELFVEEKLKLSKKGSRSGAATDKGRGRGRGPGRSFLNRCARLVKEQRARFYIARRCVTMLICWRDYP
ncbi:hypothetical protein ACMD2_11635 [Ananas comosus]|uniref:ROTUNDIFOLIA like 8 n=1 Tax=Ananas comosus TaxID=4615 RepID=A0A199UTZ9_ANACO|nr:hypothetical protein ACMD2_11635 [Ananas comosus]